MIGIGTDLVDLDRFRVVLERTPTIVDRLFTAGEQDDAAQRRDPTERLGGRFTAKEAAMKAMGVGLGSVGFREIEVRRAESGAPALVLHGSAADLAGSLGVARWLVTISHTDHLAQAVVVALGVDDGAPLAAPGGAAGTIPVIPIVTPTEMGAIDRAAPEPVEVLIGRAGATVAAAAIDLLGGTYGRRVVVIAGPGNNGNDGRDAARRLRRRGVQVRVVEPPPRDASPDTASTGALDGDLVIDAAFGTGFRGDYHAPSIRPGVPVLAVDIPSGVDGLTGAAGPGVLAAEATVTFAALKPGLLFPPGSQLAGAVRVAGIGLDTSSARTGLVEGGDVVGWLPERSPDAHKWRAAVWVIAGSPGMEGAGALVCAGAQRAGAGYVRHSSPGATPGSAPEGPVEVVRTDLPASGWSTGVLGDLDRFAALVVGNGLGTGPEAAEDVRRVVAGSGVTTVVDADGITALGRSAAECTGPTTVLTPHDGEFARLAGDPPGPDRIDAARQLAVELGCVVLLKGGPTVVASPTGEVRVVASGDARLATAGTGDVLAGVIGAIAAGGASPFDAAAAGAFLHGAAGALGWRHGLVAGDLPGLLPAVLDRIHGAPPRPVAPRRVTRP